MSFNRHPLRHEGRDTELLCRHHPGRLELALGEHRIDVEPAGRDGDLVILRMGDRVIRGAVFAEDERVLVSYGGRHWVLQRVGAKALGAAPAKAAAVGDVEAPMTGTVVEVSCRPGDRVEAGEALVLLEAMKMEHRLVAPVAARVVAVETEPGAQVDIGQVLVRLE